MSRKAATELAAGLGNVRVPFLDLSSSHAGIGEKILKGVSRVLETNAYVNGPEVETFERAFAAYCGAADCVGVSSGLDALRIALLAAGSAPEDEVIVPAMTFAATFEAVTQARCTPVVVDVSNIDYAIDVGAVASVRTDRTRFLLPVHLYGQMADVRELRALAARHEMILIEDACQAHGARRDSYAAGTAGLAAAFSFYPSKNLGAMGDAGALVTSDVELARRARALREHGQFRKYEHELEGYTARLDTLQAVVLLHKLPLLEVWNEQRRAAARFYTTQLAGAGDLRLPSVPDGSEPVWYLYVVRTREPERLGAFLAERDISTGRHYPQPPHLSRAYAQLGYRRGSFPVAESLADEGISLPLFPGMTEAQLSAVVTAIWDFFRGG